MLNKIIKESKRDFEQASKACNVSSGRLRNYNRDDFGEKIKEKLIDFIESRSQSTIDLIKKYRNQK